ncbi:GntR family transcriptional regulator [Pseudofrankia sp. DC12]|uniref:GntR family transcriptional regulator n=1 Tax=Pseudofrankia sp. DC12 TaxID=683315 RepID=UPI0005F770F7|nr:GntR family transcriptional regulator [Pseudofrankia sp. DC12]
MTEHGGETNATAKATTALRDMVMRRRLMPGQQLRQDQLAEQLNLSRSPVREALRILETEGLVRYVVNQGYFVAEFNAAELQQIYLMRRLLEAELLRTARRPADDDLAALRAHNAAVTAGGEAGSITEMLVANRRFHFALLGLSPLLLVRREVVRLWHLSEAYRAGYLWIPETRDRIVAEHLAMVDALADYDLGRLVDIAEQHRNSAERTVLGLFADTVGDSPARR